ncbi:hypothetical protein IAT40_004251 [Kwoniella sp. CBS 6097]
MSSPVLQARSPSSSSSSELLYPTFPSSSKTDRLSYATSSPPTPNPADLFFKPPKSSPRTPPVRSPEPMPDSLGTSSDKKGKGKEPISSGNKKKREKSRLSSMMDSPDTGDYMAQLPSVASSSGGKGGGGHGHGVFVGTGLDARSLADMLSPPDVRSPSSGKEKGKRKHRDYKTKEKGKGKVKAKAKAEVAASERGEDFGASARSRTASDNSQLPTGSSPPATPPPLPPKSIRTTPKSTRTTATTFTDMSITPSRSRSSHTHSTETDFHSTSPQQAVYGQMASASSHQILGKPSLQSLMQAQQAAKYQNVPLKSGESATTGTGTGTGTLTAGPTTSTSTMTYIPDISESMDHYRRDSFTLEGALAALPWAEPPPRDPTLLPLPPGHPFGTSTSNGQNLENGVSGSPALISSTFHSQPGTARTPTYSFLTSDPAARSASYRSPLSQDQSHDRSRRSSRVPSVPQSPSVDQHSHLGQLEVGPDGRRYSAQSAYSGMADQVTPTQTSTSGFGDSHSSPSRSQSQNQGQGQHGHSTSVSTSIGEGMSFGSAMATQGSSYSDVVVGAGQGHAKGKRSWSNWSFGAATKSRSKSPASDRSKSIRSTKSTRSSKSKRASNSTLAHGQSAGYGGYGKSGSSGGAGGWKWEIRRYEELDGDEEDGDGREIVRSKEEMMELATLVGRAAVLERMLKSGKRVSSQSVRQLLRSFTPSSHASPLPPLPTHRPSLSLTVSSPSASISITSNINGDIKSNRRVSKRSSYANSVHHSQSHSKAPCTSSGSGGSDSPRSSDTRRRSSPASIVAVGISQGLGPASIEERLKRRLERSESREDIFTEIGSSHGHDDGYDVVDGDGGVWVGEEITLLPSSSAAKGNGTAHRRRSSGDHNPGRGNRRKKSVREVDNMEKEKEQERVRGEDRIGGKGVIVFPEEIGTFGRPTATATATAAVINDNDQSGQVDNFSVGTQGRVGPTVPAIAHIKGDRRSMINCTSSNGVLGNCINKVSLDRNGIPSYYATQPSFNPTIVYGEPVHERETIDLEKGIKEKLPRYDSKGRPYYPQSPHLGHRSPNWRNRQSVLSYISANGWQDDSVYDRDRDSVRRKKWRWKVGLGAGSGLLIILIIGLLVGLLVKRDETGMSV